MGKRARVQTRQKCWHERHTNGITTVEFIIDVAWFRSKSKSDARAKSKIESERFLAAPWKNIAKKAVKGSVATTRQLGIHPKDSTEKAKLQIEICMTKLKVICLSFKMSFNMSSF